jgi:hypothetical protein
MNKGALLTRLIWHSWPVRCAQAWRKPPMTTDREKVNCPDCRRALDADAQDEERVR